MTVTIEQPGVTSFVPREGLESVAPLDPRGFFPVMGECAIRLTREGRAVESDGKALLDLVLAAYGANIEGAVSVLYADGLSSVDIVERAAAEYGICDEDDQRTYALPGESLDDQAHRLRKALEHTVKINGHELRVEGTCEGRFQWEVYTLDSTSVSKGHLETRDIEMNQDLVDFHTVHILQNGYPFNGMLLRPRYNGNPMQEANYYAGRSQLPTYYDMVADLAKLGGDEVFTNLPYVKAMERVWDHFHPDPELLASQPPGRLYAYKRGGITPEGLPFALYGDDMNNGRKPENYIGRLESLDEDLTAADEAAERVRQEGGTEEEAMRVRSDVLISLLEAGESGWDVSTGRMAGGKGLSYMNTRNIIFTELQATQSKGAGVLAHSFRLLGRKAEASGDTEQAELYRQKQDYYERFQELHNEFIRVYGYDSETGAVHDIELVGATGSYDSLHTYHGARRTPVISAGMGYVFGIGALNDEELVTVARVGKRELFGPGGVAATNITTGQQWDGRGCWASNAQAWVYGAIEEAARQLVRGNTDLAEFFIDLAIEAQTGALHGAEAGQQATGLILETTDTEHPGEIPDSGEYPKDPKNRKAPQNFAMWAELAIALRRLDVRERAYAIAAAGGPLALHLTLAA